MLNIEIITEPIEQTLRDMETRIEVLGRTQMPDELTAWQTEDMHRHYPNTDTPDNKTAVTDIWPRSRTYEKTHHKTAPLPARIHRRPIAAMPRLKGTGHTPGTMRPILRAELFQRRH